MRPSEGFGTTNRIVAWAAAGLLLISSASLHASAADAPIADDPFEQEYREQFVSGDSSRQNEIRAIASDAKKRIWIASGGGVFYRDGDAWQPVLAQGPAFALEVDEQGNIWIGHWKGLFRATAKDDGYRIEQAAEIKVPIAAIACGSGRVVAGGPDGYWERDAEGVFQKLEIPVGADLQDLLIVGDTLLVATQTGLYDVKGKTTRRLHKADELLSCDVRALALGPDGRLWVGSSGGIDVFEGGRRVASYTGREGLPSTRVHSLAFDPEGVLWVGMAIGLARLDGQTWTLRHSLRWLPSDSVQGVAFNDGAAWVATSAGIGVLRRRPMTLADKAAYFEQIVRQRHVRPPGLVRKCRLDNPGDLQNFRPTDTDNDGLFSALYLAAESFRYAVTKDETARKNAAEVYRGLEFLQTVTDTEGFVARTVVPSDWTSVADRNRTYTPQQVAEERVRNPRFKRVENRWRLSRDGRWLWKGDTSSDEISGHYFGYAVYYDLAADEQERSRIREHVRRITDYIIDGGYELLDIDGKHTLWGVWSPAKLNGDPNWFSERGINSMEILSFLRIAHHMTGQPRYADLAAELLDKHGYRQNVRVTKLDSPAEFTFIDDQLLALGYRAVFAYSPDDADRAIFRPGLDQWHGVIRDVHSPLYDFTYRIATGESIELDKNAEYLRDVPLDLVSWSIDNSRREDIALVGRPYIDRRNTSRLLPPSERAVIQWDGNPYSASDGGGGREECEPHFWLLPYWMGRHHGLIAPPDGT